MTRRSPDREAPLRAWAAALRLRRSNRCRLRRVGVAGGVPTLLVLATIAAPPAPRLVWNASPSAPVGLYRVMPGAPVARGDMLLARLPEPWRAFAAGRRYLPANVPLVKRAAAVAGDDVCAFGPAIFVNGVAVAARGAADPRGRSLPRWDGCVRLEEGQVLPLMDRADSFDGRYFGVLEARDVIGRAELLCRR
ncbi:MAG TPA: S26 family signal peptidase [Sphingomonas sp.]|nr:S26 family signal peptidase [Sphingomonas sp.]